MKSEFYLTTPKGLFFYTLWENSNFLGNSPSQWYLFAHDRAIVYGTYEEAREDKDYLLVRITRAGTDYIENHLKVNGFPAEYIEEHQKKIKRVLKHFGSLNITEKVMAIN